MGLVVLLVLGYREARDEAMTCRDAQVFAWFQNEMSAEDAVIRGVRPSIPDADRATQFLSLSLEYESASREYRVLADVASEERSDWLPWPELGRALERRAERAEHIALVYKDAKDALASSERDRMGDRVRRIELADAALLRRAEEALREWDFAVQPGGRFVVRC